MPKATFEELDEETLEDLYNWVDEIPLSRPKKNINRDFSDGVLMAEIIKHFFPRIIESHNYIPTSAAKKKEENWSTLNRKVFPKLGMTISKDVVADIVDCKPNVIETVLNKLKLRINDIMWNKKNKTKNHLEDSDDGSCSSGMSENSPVQIINVGGEPQRYVPLHLVREKEHELSLVKKELATRQETLELLEAKVQRLEKLTQLKDDRIEELILKLEKIKPPRLGPIKNVANT